MGVVAAFAAVIKPLLVQFMPTKPYETLLAGYKVLDFDLCEIKTSIEQKQKIDKDVEENFEKTKKHERLLIEKDPEAKNDRKLILRLQKEVESEFPVENFFIP